MKVVIANLFTSAAFFTFGIIAFINDGSTMHGWPAIIAGAIFLVGAQILEAIGIAQREIINNRNKAKSSRADS